MQSLFVFLGKTKISDFLWKKADVTSPQGVCHMIYMFCRSPSVKV